MQSFEYRSVRSWSKEINGTRTGGRKMFFLIRGDDAALAHSGRTGLILSIRGPEASLGSLRVGVYMVSRLHRIRRRFEHYRPILSALQAIWA